MRKLLGFIGVLVSLNVGAAPALLDSEFDYRQLRWLSRSMATNQTLDSGALRPADVGNPDLFDESVVNSFGQASQTAFMQRSGLNDGPVYLYGSGDASAVQGASGTYNTVESTFMASFEAAESFEATVSGELVASYVNTIGIRLPAATVRIWQGPAVFGTLLWSSEAVEERLNERLPFSHSRTYEPNVMYVLEVSAVATAYNNPPDEDPNSESQSGGWEFAFELDAADVQIDVLPGDAANEVFPNKGGQLPVAVLSSPEFDATQVNPASLRFGAAAATIAAPVVIDDVDSLHGNDTVARFKVQDSGILCDDTEVALSGETYAGDPIAGVGTIDASQCESGGCHLYGP